MGGAATPAQRGQGVGAAGAAAPKRRTATLSALAPTSSVSAVATRQRYSGLSLGSRYTASCRTMAASLITPRSCTPARPPPAAASAPRPEGPATGLVSPGGDSASDGALPAGAAVASTSSTFGCCPLPCARPGAGVPPRARAAGVPPAPTLLASGPVRRGQSVGEAAAAGAGAAGAGAPREAARAGPAWQTAAPCPLRWPTSAAAASARPFRVSAVSLQACSRPSRDPIEDAK